MLRYNANLKGKARQLRKNLTDSERALWSRLRNKQLIGVQFYRQKPIGAHVVDFYTPRAKLVVEVDGSQHMQSAHAQKDRTRDEYFSSLGLKVLRFNSREVLKESDAVMEVILRTMKERLNEKSPRPPFNQRGKILYLPFEKGGWEGFRRPFQTASSPPLSPSWRGRQGVGAT